MSRFPPPNKRPQAFRRLIHTKAQCSSEYRGRLGRLWERLKQQFGLVLVLISLVFIITDIPNFIHSFQEEDFFADSLLSKMSQSTPIWYSSFEKGFPGEWSNDGNSNAIRRFFKGDRFKTSVATQGIILNQKQAQAQNILPIQGSHLYKASIRHSDSAGKNHRAYPVLEMSQADPQFLERSPTPLMNRFYIWVESEKSHLQKTDWISFFAFANNRKNQTISLAMVGPNNQLKLTHLGEFNHFSEGDGWENLTELDAISMPLNQWVRFTVYLDYQRPLMVVWMNGKPIFRANGGNLKLQPGNLLTLLQAHWGLTSNGSLNHGTLYNDFIQLWTVSQPLTNFAKEPLSPFDGRGIETSP